MTAPAGPARSPHRADAVLWLAAVGVLAIAVWRDAWPWIADDTFISLRYAENLLHGHGLVWNPGERVEGYSNLLWVLLVAALGALGIDLVTAARALAGACTAGTFAVLLFSRLLPRELPARLVVLVLAAAAPVAIWAVAGLETPLAVLLIALAMAALGRALADDEERRQRWLRNAGAMLALLAWTRPDGPLWAAVAAAVVGLHTRRGQRRRAIVTLLALPAFAVLAQLAFRLAYYGDWIPNTGHAKVSALAVSLDQGATYLWSAAVALRSLLALVVLGAALGWRDRRARPVLAFSAAGAVVWLLYVLRVGGDAFPGSRLVLVAVAPLALLAAHGLAGLARRGRAGLVAAWGVALLAVALARYDAERPSDDLHQQLWRWQGRAAALGDWLGRAFAERSPLVAVDAAGAVPYFSRLPSLDMLGLCDRTIARTPPAEDRTFIAGHHRGNGAYVLSRRPDLVLFHIPGSGLVPFWQSGIEMISDPAFFAHYRLVSVETGPVTAVGETFANVPAVLWVRVDGRAGVQREGATVRVPGLLLGSWRQPFPLVDWEPGVRWLREAAVIGLLDGGELAAEVRQAGRHALRGLPLPRGNWRAVDPPLPDGVGVTLTPVGAGTFDLELDVPASTPLPFRVREIVLQQDR